MQFKNFFTDEDAVSPVIGVILMVAITVILAAVIGAFVLGIGGSQESAPQVQWDWSTDASSEQVTLKHGGGETVTSPAQITATDSNDNIASGNGEDLSTAGMGSSGSISSGDSNTWTLGTDTQGTVTLTWQSSSGDSSQILSEHEYDLN